MNGSLGSGNENDILLISKFIISVRAACYFDDNTIRIKYYYCIICNINMFYSLVN